MRILHAVHGFFPEFSGGTERYVEALALAQARAGHGVRLLCGSGCAGDTPWIDLTRHRGLPLYRLHRIGIDIDHWTKSDAPHAEGPLGMLIRQLQPDVLHVHHWLRFSRGLVRLAAPAGVAVVLTLHDLASTCPRGFRIDVEGHFCERAMGPEACLGCAPAFPWQDPEELRLELARFRSDMRAEVQAAARVVVPSRTHGELLARLHDMPIERITALPLGDITSVSAAPRRQPRKDDGRLRLVHWGHFRADKGVHVLLEALALLPAPARARLHLTLHGEHVFDDYRERLEALAHGLPVTFAGAYAPETLEVADQDLAVIPTLCFESHSFVLDEAFRLGLPLVVSDRGALAERAGAAALSFEAGDAAGLAARILEVLDDREVLTRLRAAIPASLLSMDDHAAALEEVYRAAAAAGPPPGVTPLPLTSERLARARAVETRDIRIAELRWALDNRRQ